MIDAAGKPNLKTDKIKNGKKSVPQFLKLESGLD
jgi:hypothetical protein